MADPGTHCHLDEMKPWNDRTQLLEVIGITDEAPEVKTFTFRADARTWFRYQPGQFITLELPRAEGMLTRRKSTSAIRTPVCRKPASTARSFRRLLEKSSAPTSSTSETATRKTTNTWRIPKGSRLPVSPRPCCAWRRLQQCGSRATQESVRITGRSGLRG